MIHHRTEILAIAIRCLVLVGTLISLVALGGYVAHFDLLLNWGFQQQMAFPTALVLLCNCLALHLVAGVLTSLSASLAAIDKARRA